MSGFFLMRGIIKHSDTSSVLLWLSLKCDFLQKLKQYPFSDNRNLSGFFPKTRAFVEAEAPSRLSLCENVTLC